MDFILDFPSKLFLKGDDYVIMRPDISEQEFWEISNEDTNFELIDGVLIIHSPASTEHEEIFTYLMKILGFYLEEAEIGKVFGSRLVMRLSPKWNPEPDLMIVLRDNFHKIQPTKIEGPADIVIEILSKSTRDIDLNKKLPFYLQSGVKEVWLIDPDRKEFSIHWSDSDLLITKDHTELPSKLISELKFNPNWLWDRERFPSNSVIKEILTNSKKSD
jgi:Uma2 family endonuclease